MRARLVPDKMSLDQAILHLVSTHVVPDQATLLSLLAQEGFSLTQGTLSRHLAKLSIQKREGHYQRVIPKDHPLPPYELHLSPPNLILLTTGPGFGMALAVRVDRSHIPGVAGSIAGEDSLLIVIAGGTPIAEVQARLIEILGQPQD